MCFAVYVQNVTVFLFLIVRILFPNIKFRLILRSVITMFRLGVRGWGVNAF